MQAAQLLFVVAEMLRAVGAAKTGIAVLEISFRSKICTQLPAQQEQQRQAKQHICKRVPEENQGREHHYKVPIVNPAAAAAFVEHHPALEGAEKQNAYHVAD